MHACCQGPWPAWTPSLEAALSRAGWSRSWFGEPIWNLYNDGIEAWAETVSVIKAWLGEQRTVLSRGVGPGQGESPALTGTGSHSAELTAGH